VQVAVQLVLLLTGDPLMFLMFVFLLVLLPFGHQFVPTGHEHEQETEGDGKSQEGGVDGTQG
jgi:hypothetical protein